MGRKVIIISNNMRNRKVNQEDVRKVFYLTPKPLPKIPCFGFKVRRTISEDTTDNEI